MKPKKMIDGVIVEMTDEEIAEMQRQQAEYEEQLKNQPPTLEEQVAMLSDYILNHVGQ